MTKLTAEYLIDDLTPAERQRAERVEAILPTLKARAEAEQEAIRRKAMQETRDNDARHQQE